MRSSIFRKVRSSYIFEKKWNHLPFKKNWGRLPFSKKNEVVFHFQKKWGRLSFSKKIEVVFHFQKNWGHLPFSKKLRSSSIFQNIEVVFQFLWAYLINGKYVIIHKSSQIENLSLRCKCLKKSSNYEIQVWPCCTACLLCNMEILSKLNNEAAFIWNVQNLCPLLYCWQNKIGFLRKGSFQFVK